MKETGILVKANATTREAIEGEAEVDIEVQAGGRIAPIMAQEEQMHYTEKDQTAIQQVMYRTTAMMEVTIVDGVVEANRAIEVDGVVEVVEVGGVVVVVVAVEVDEVIEVVKAINVKWGGGQWEEVSLVVYRHCHVYAKYFSSIVRGDWDLGCKFEVVVICF